MQEFYIIFFFILGSVLASFYDVVATRLPVGKSIVKPRSHCEFCNHELVWYELIPIFSFLVFKGKCYQCHKPISISSFVAELSLGILFSLSYWYYGFSYEFGIALVLSSLLILIFISDIKYMIILDSPLVLGSLFILLNQYFSFGIERVGMSIMAGVVLFLFMYGMGLFGNKLFQKESLGGGDIKLSFVIGITLGIPLGFTSLILSTFLALPYATFSLLTNQDHEVAFGPFLISALCIVFLFEEKFLLLIELLTGGFL